MKFNEVTTFSLWMRLLLHSKGLVKKRALFSQINEIDGKRETNRYATYSLELS